MSSFSRKTIPLLAGLALASGACVVPKARYDQVVAQADAEHAVVMEAEAEAEQCERRRAILNEHLQVAEANTRSVENARSGLQVELTVVRRERDDAQLLVDQLRGELERVGSDVRTFAGRNAQLQESMGQLEARVEALAAAEAAAEARTEAFSDLALGLRTDLARGVVDLELVAGHPVVLVKPRAVTRRGISAEAVAAVRIVGRVVATRSSSRVEVRLSPPADEAFGEAVAKALTEGGLGATRITVRPPAGARTTSVAQLIVDLGAPRPSG
jgi:hypothetical protein